MKKSHIFMIVLIFSLAVVAAYTYSEQNSTGSLLGITETTLDESEETTYYVVAFTQQLNPTEQIITKKVTDDVDGVNSNGESVEGTITADFTLDVESLGWQHDIIKQTSPNYVNHLEDTVTGWFPSLSDGFVSLDHTYANGFTYYQMSDESWEINSQYEPKVTIDGKTYSAGMRTYGKDTSGTRIEIQGDSDKPSIYYEEVMFGMGSQTASEPQLGRVEIIPYGGTMMFTNYNEKSVTTIVNDWNYVMAGKDGLFTDGEDVYDHRESLDMNGDKEADTDNIDLDISFEDFVTNDWQYEASTSPSTWKTLVNPIDYEYTTSSGNAVHYDQYDLITGGDAKLVYNTPLVVVGTWHIPVEYGDVKVIESNPIPEITSFGMVGDLTDNQGTASYNVKVECTSGEGRISVQIVQDEENSIPLIIEPDSIQSQSFETGEEKEFTFKLIADDVNGNVENGISIIATGSGGAQDIKQDTIGIIDIDNYDEEDMVSITVNAISIVDGDPLTTHPVIINGDTQYGTWSGKVIPNIDIEVTGKQFEDYTPQPSQTIKATADGDSFNFKYQPSTGGSTGGINWWVVTAIGAVVLILLIGSTYFLLSGKKGTKRSEFMAATNKGIILVGAGFLIALLLTCFLIVDNGDEVTAIIDNIINPSDSSETTGTVTVILPTGESKTMENFNPTTEGLLSVRTTKSYPNLIVTINNDVVDMPYFQNVTPNNYAITATAFGYDNFNKNVNVKAGIQINDVIIKMDKTVVEENEEGSEEIIGEPIGE